VCVSFIHSFIFLFVFFLILKNIINQLKYITFLFYNTKISDNNAESGKVSRMLAAFEWQGKSSRKRISLILNRLIPQ
jgi:hypothetical protein